MTRKNISVGIHIKSETERNLAKRFMNCEKKLSLFPDSSRFLTEFPVGLGKISELFPSNEENLARMYGGLKSKNIDLIGATKMSADWGIGRSDDAQQALIRTKTTHPKRFIDNVASDHVWVFEIKGTLGHKAIGQVQTYDTLLYHDLDSYYRRQLKVKKGIICGATDRLLELTCTRHGIEVFVV